MQGGNERRGLGGDARAAGEDVQGGALAEEEGVDGAGDGGAGCDLVFGEAVAFADVPVDSYRF